MKKQIYKITFPTNKIYIGKGVNGHPLNFDIEESTFKSICDNAQRIEIISQERITDELNKIITELRDTF